MKSFFHLFLLCFGFMGFGFMACQNPTGGNALTNEPLVIPDIPAETLTKVPDWAKTAVWYQIFPERFRNGDASNDPTLHDIEGSWPQVKPANWRVKKWTSDWYAQDDWEKGTGKDVYYTIQLRRYGGDLQGLMDKLDYLKDLGVTALFINPLNDSPSLHKYDARNYHHIDRNFGSDPKGDEALAKQEDPANPASWKMSSADQKFLDVVKAVHARGMKIIMDYSWNHTGTQFWAFQDVLKNGAKSKYKDWYYINSFDNPATPDTNEFSYKGWANVKELPELRKVDVKERVNGRAYEGDLQPDAKQHVLQVTKRWMDPNNDGNPDDGVDGFRLDVAEQVPLGFWRDYRRFVRGINPEAFLVGEIWWEKYPETMTDPAPYLQGDIFDAVMNYRWYKQTREFLAGINPAFTATQYVAQLEALKTGIDVEHQKALMNLMSSHDTERVSTSVYNKGKYKFQASPNQNRAYKINRPDSLARAVQKLLLVQQFTYIGAPHIWYGDEVGMWGADDPDGRKPMLWSDLKYDMETAMPFGGTRTADPVGVDTEWLDFYKKLIAMRQNNLNLFVDAPLEVLIANDKFGLLMYRRNLTINGKDKMALVFLNAGNQTIPLSGAVAGQITADMTFRNPLNPSETYAATVANPSLSFKMPPHSYKVLIND